MINILRIRLFDKLIYKILIKSVIHGAKPLDLVLLNKLVINARWFKYDRDCNRLVYTQTVPVVFEPPCIISGKINISKTYNCIILKKQKQSR